MRCRWARLPRIMFWHGHCCCSAHWLSYHQGVTYRIMLVFEDVFLKWRRVLKKIFFLKFFSSFLSNSLASISEFTNHFLNWKAILNFPSPVVRQQKISNYYYIYEYNPTEIWKNESCKCRKIQIEMKNLLQM